MNPRFSMPVLWLAAGFLAFFVQGRIGPGEAYSGQPADPLSHFVGSAKEAFGDTLFLKADAYFHGGVMDHDRDMESEEEVQKETAREGKTPLLHSTRISEIK